MLNNKKIWTKPQLIVLTRGTPEENVLTHCKRIGNVGIDNPQSTQQTGCDLGQDVGGVCANCQSRSGS
jgi:hypothetical protein